MATEISNVYEASSKLAKYAFEPYWPDKKLRICVTGAGGFIARCVLLTHENLSLARRAPASAGRRHARTPHLTTLCNVELASAADRAVSSLDSTHWTLPHTLQPSGQAPEVRGPLHHRV